MAISQDYVPGEHPDLKPPLGQTGILFWLRKNFFSSTFNIVLTLATLYCLYLVLPAAFQFTYGFYPLEERWRVNLTFLLFVVALLPVLWDKMPKRNKWVWFSLAFPFIAAWLLLGDSSSSWSAV